jgi:hypothetical protein
MQGILVLGGGLLGDEGRSKLDLIDTITRGIGVDLDTEGDEEGRGYIF